MHRVGDIKRVIDRKLYDTETATALHTFEPYEDVSDFHYSVKTLYETPNGRYFIAGEGGPMTQFAEAQGGGSYSGGRGIYPVDEWEAVEFLESTDGVDVLMEKFPSYIEEA